MQNIESESEAEKPVNKLSRNKRNFLSDEINNEIDRQKKIAILAYQRAEKRGFAGSEADALHDWLEAEKEVKLSNLILNP